MILVPQIDNDAQKFQKLNFVSNSGSTQVSLYLKSIKADLCELRDVCLCITLPTFEPLNPSS
jgi:hypothetical protein